MDWMYANCSATAQRGALDWRHEFREATLPVFENLYESVATGEETRIVLEANSAPDYQEKLMRNCGRCANPKCGRAGAAVRSLRPENWNEVNSLMTCPSRFERRESRL